MRTHQLTAERLRKVLDYDPISGVFTWRIGRGKTRVGGQAGSPDKEGYIVIGIDYRAHKAHRLAWLHQHGAWPVGVIDHRNGIPSDNRLHNLREADAAINAQNRRVSSRGAKLGVLGVTPRRTRFIAQIQAGGRKVLLGVFDTASAAHNAYIEAKRAAHPGCTI